ncbi:flagellar basal-body MS-ring/collar protein FliF [Citrobacter enshiensis]|uniref:flagellar basal-body MS-ring/collar protein FliF n=1 Tax=Citrobacter enshiensis TaxID=2971264 RepID=UPI0023E7584D|nr:flagellar basal-body MS-ring/collar protein FliF [Citrobacter enshiensis]WET39865.1 flagellar basal-body MS-ring/collar protein FliF [Citrobacter enshiensis]
MRQKFKTIWDNISKPLPAITLLRNKVPQLMLLGMLTCLIAVLVVLFLWSSQGNYRPLYGQQERFDSAQIMAILDQEHIAYRLLDTTGQVLVEEDKLSQARMLLAAKGVQAKLPVGLESLEKESTLGTSQFVENARYRRGLEGELARTIMSMQGIDFARVHLAIPDKMIFLRGNEEKPSASVMLELSAANSRMEPGQVLAIVNLVKGSVSNLTTENISVVDQYGHLLTQDLNDELSGTRLTSHQLDYQKQVERSYERRVSEMLQPVLGANNYKVQVTAHLIFDNVEETRESLDKSPVVREERLQKDASQGGQLSGIPGALSNRPPVTDPQQQGNQAQTPPATAERLINEKDEQQRRYDVGRTITHTKYQQGRLNNLSVSVVLNQTVSPEKGWSAEQLTNIRQMALDAVGFDQTRGDQLSLNVFPFSEDGINPALDSQWWQEPVLLIYARYLVATILGLCLIFFVIRKLMQHLIQRSPANGSDNAENASATQVTSDKRESEESEYFRKHNRNLAFDKVRLNELPDTNSPLRDKLAHLQLLADHDPKRVAEVLEQWMNSR